MFRVYDELVQFQYLKSFRRVRIIYSTEEQTQLAQDNLNNHVFEGSSLQLRPVKVSRTHCFPVCCKISLIAYFNWCPYSCDSKENPAVSHLPSRLSTCGLGTDRRGLSCGGLQSSHCLSPAPITRLHGMAECSIYGRTCSLHVH